MTLKEVLKEVFYVRKEDASHGRLSLGNVFYTVHDIARWNANQSEYVYFKDEKAMKGFLETHSVQHTFFFEYLS